MKALDYFLKYIKIDTTSNPESETVPSSENQLVLASILLEDLKQLNMDEAFIKTGYVYAKLNNNTNNKDLKSVGFIAHMDTSCDSSGYNINHRIINNYQGEDIILNPNMVLSLKEFTSLKSSINHDLVVTDGTTLLGADDKAGIAEIMGLLTYIKENNVPHGDIYICFTPDEEIGRGVDHFDYDFFKADFSYTIDGGEVGYIDYQNFNAASAIVTLNGVSIHPGEAKNKMINSIILFEEFNNLLPKFLNPAYTSNDEGFNHVTNISGSCEKTVVSYIIRNHHKDQFIKQQNDFLMIKDFMNKKYNYNAVEVVIKESYQNMYEVIKDHYEVVDLAEKAISKFMKPNSSYIRGGTDGARLTFEGVYCPNLGTGGYNFHGPYEYLDINQMNLSVDILKEIVELVKDGYNGK
jgi:tripeptide aminopeptidase